jgi:hypothetical protein
MSLYDYKRSQDGVLQVAPFYALIMAAMRNADTHNLNQLQIAFPHVWQEFQARYNAPGGRLPEDDSGN